MASSAETADADMVVADTIEDHAVDGSTVAGISTAENAVDGSSVAGISSAGDAVGGSTVAGTSSAEKPLTPYGQELLYRAPLGDTATLLKERLTHYRASLNAQSLDDAVVSTDSKTL